VKRKEIIQATNYY